MIDYVGKIISNPSSVLYVAIYLEKGGRVPGRQTGGRNKWESTEDLKRVANRSFNLGFLFFYFWFLLEGK